MVLDWKSHELGISPYIVRIWHEHRVPILYAVLFASVLLRLFQYWTGKERDVVVHASRKDKTAAEIDGKITRRLIPGVPRRIKGGRNKAGRRKTDEDGKRSVQVLVFYCSLTGSTEKIARDFARTLQVSPREATGGTDIRFLTPCVLDLADVDLDEYFISPPEIRHDDGTKADLFYLLLLPSYNIDSINDTFIEHLQETHHDFRIDTTPLASILGYSVFGFGDRDGWPTEEEGYCRQAKEVDEWMAKLTGRKRAYPLGMGDWKKDGQARMEEWQAGITEVLRQLEQTERLGEELRGSGSRLESEQEDEEDEEDEEKDGKVALDGSPVANTSQLKKAGRIDDLEDLGRIMEMTQTSDGNGTGDRPPAPSAGDFKSQGKSRASGVAAGSVKEMVPKASPTYTALTKQGYSIVGSHSGVKICRWTKSALRGRGSCYKFSFYGIHSHQCMETTPSLSCSNKCVFCWRHGTNPVGTSWRWIVDPPDMIFEGVKAKHYEKIKMMRGVPGVRAERFAEAMRIRHCALSLVGEPIFYPHVNAFLALLHRERISSFLVCNAQHPDQLAALDRVTQLYVSIDASNRDSLQRIDRPLHRDFWERFQRCLAILREQRFRHRTVFRLTLVKGFNVEDEAEGYADLVGQALPCFVEIKGVTYCGTSTSSSAGLTMANVPFYHEVCAFVTALEAALRRRGLAYGIAAEHAHSCCVLVASERFRVEGRWHTLIDYERFFDLLEEKGPDGDFRPEDYMGPETPEWATWGRGGFDPRDQRVDRKGRAI